MTVDFPPVTPPSESFQERLRLNDSRISRSRAVVDQAALWLADCLDGSLAEARLIVVAGDHPVPEGASNLPAGTNTFDEAVSATAQEVGVGIEWIQADHESQRADQHDTLTQEACDAALQAGVDLANRHADEGTRMLLVGDYGRGLTSTAASLIGSICSVEPVKIVGRGSGIDDQQWRVKTAYIRDAMFRVRDDRASAARMLRRAATADVVTLCGLLAQSAVRRTPVMFDGVGATAAALLAHMLVPGSSSWWWAATAGTEPATKAALDQLGMKPVVVTGVPSHQGSGALTTLPMVRHAVRTVQEELGS